MNAITIGRWAAVALTLLARRNSLRARKIAQDALVRASGRSDLPQHARVAVVEELLAVSVLADPYLRLVYDLLLKAVAQACNQLANSRVPRLREVRSRPMIQRMRVSIGEQASAPRAVIAGDAAFSGCRERPSPALKGRSGVPSWITSAESSWKNRSPSSS